MTRSKLRNVLAKLLRSERGAAAVEYAIMVALIASGDRLPGMINDRGFRHRALQHWGYQHHNPCVRQGRKLLNRAPLGSSWVDPDTLSNMLNY